MLSLFIYLILIILGLFFPRNKYIFYFQWCLISIAILFNKGGADFKEYNIIYNYYYTESSIKVESEFIYKYFSKISNNIYGLEFTEFNFIINVPFILILIYLVYNKSKYFSLVTSLIMLFPGVDMVIQKRNFIAMVLILVSFFILTSDINNKYFYSFAFILIAQGFHAMSIIYIFFIILFLFRNFLLRNIYWFSVLFIFLFPLIFPYLAPLFMSETKFLLYFKDSNFAIDLLDAVVFSVNHFIFILISIIIIKKQGYFDNKKSIIFILLIIINFSSIYFLGSTFIRILRVIVIYIYCMLFSEHSTYYKNKKISIHYIYFIILVFINNIIWYFMGKGFSVIILPIFTENSVFEIINNIL